MSSSQNPQQTLMGCRWTSKRNFRDKYLETWIDGITVTGISIFKKAIEKARKPLLRSFQPGDSVDKIREKMSLMAITTDWISHLGHPLFGTYWDSLPVDHRNIMDYTKQKLLFGPTVLENNPNGVLACPSIRLAVMFIMDISARDKLVTMAGSKPLLAEATYDLMKDMEMNAVRHLANHSCVDRGRRGELVATLLIMQGFDAAWAISNPSVVTNCHNNRWVTVVDFMRASLPESNYRALLRPSASFAIPSRSGKVIETYYPFQGTTHLFGTASSWCSAKRSLCGEDDIKCDRAHIAWLTRTRACL
ncbi:hypothetical protein F5148DRAFT_1317689 [Russula earlei]|uniref:Uncharacterized protein n=1 Tax=Russula earlei TaxID=71964 RepID=A0ACC0UNM9_9AGAM|nr:hypothetical protein F5148DRAFT_1317689 [Russula earlei]